MGVVLLFFDWLEVSKLTIGPLWLLITLLMVSQTPRDGAALLARFTMSTEQLGASIMSLCWSTLTGRAIVALMLHPRRSRCTPYKLERGLNFPMHTRHPDMTSAQTPMDPSDST